MGRHVWSFCWHNVTGTWCFPGQGDDRRLVQQLRLLARTTHVLSLEDVARRLAAGAPLPPRATVLTFDDGYADNLHLAVPTLSRLGLPATFFLVPGLLSREVRPWWEVVSQAVQLTERSTVEVLGTRIEVPAHGSRLRAAGQVRELLKTVDRTTRDAAVAELLAWTGPAGASPVENLFLDWDGARELVRRGFSVGSHTWHHDILSRQSAAEQHEDLLRSRSELQERLQVPADLLAYPNGGRQDYDGGSLAAAAAARHSLAMTTVPGTNVAETPRYEQHRYVVDPRRGAVDFGKVLKHALVRPTADGRGRPLAAAH